MQVRLDPARGGEGIITGVSVINDTGSNIMVIFHDDLARLGRTSYFNGWTGTVDVGDASGRLEKFQRILLQVRLVNRQHEPITDWMDEYAICKPGGPNMPRVTGFAIRQHLFFATPPGNNYVAVGTDKAGIMSLI